MLLGLSNLSKHTLESLSIINRLIVSLVLLLSSSIYGKATVLKSATDKNTDANSIIFEPRRYFLLLGDFTRMSPDARVDNVLDTVLLCMSSFWDISDTPCSGVSTVKQCKISRAVLKVLMYCFCCVLCNHVSSLYKL